MNSHTTATKPTTRELLIECRYKLFHSDQTPSLGTVTAKVNHKGHIRFSNPHFNAGITEISDFALARHFETIRSHIKSFLADPLYCYIWSEEIGWESYIKEVQP